MLESHLRKHYDLLNNINARYIADIEDEESVPYSAYHAGTTSNNSHPVITPYFLWSLKTCNPMPRLLMPFVF